MAERIIRVFPRKTKASPRDPLAYFGPPDLFAEADEIHISVTFTWDLKKAEELAKQWSPVAPVKIGGPATGQRSEEFVPGRYLKEGYVITSRGCVNKCWFCDAWKREGLGIREIPITTGYNVLDDNLLACSTAHQSRVFEMLRTQKMGRVIFSGGLEAKRFGPWQAGEIRRLNYNALFFAYDEPDDYEPLVRASQILKDFWILRKRNDIRSYVLCGYKGDSTAKAEERMLQVLRLGMIPMAMLYRDKDGKRSREWMDFQWKWTRPARINALRRELWKG